MCQSSDPFVIVNKKLKSKKGKVGSSYNYEIFGFIGQEKNTSRIIPYNESHIVVYPNQSYLTDGSFALTVFQDQILTQVDLVGNFQAKCRRQLIEKVIDGAKIYKQNPLNLFRARSVYWGEDFKLLNATIPPVFDWWLVSADIERIAAFLEIRPERALVSEQFGFLLK